MPTPTEKPTTPTPNPTETPTPPEPKPTDGGHVSREEFEHVKADMHKYKTEAQTLRKAQEDARTAKLKEEAKWQELAEAREKEIETLRTDNQRIQDSYVNDRKFSALREKCQALGLRKEAISDLEGLDLGDITVETTNTGRVNILGADKFANRLKTLKPHWFSDPKTTPNVNTSSTRVITSDSGNVTTADIIAAEREGRKTGDMSKYLDLCDKYRKQRSGVA